MPVQQLYVLFDPVSGRKKLEQQNLSPSQIENLEDRCLMLICKVLEKSNYALLTDDEYTVATSGHYLLDFQIAVDSSKVRIANFSSVTSRLQHKGKGSSLGFVSIILCCFELLLPLYCNVYLQLAVLAICCR